MNAEAKPERHEQWVGLDYVERNGLPGYPKCEKPQVNRGRIARPRERNENDMGEAC